MSPRGLTQEHLPKEARAGSSRSNSRLPTRVRPPRPALPLLRLQGYVVHDAPLLLLARLCRQTRAMSLGQILIVLNRWDAAPVVWLIHPLEITHIQGLLPFAVGEH